MSIFILNLRNLFYVIDKLEEDKKQGFTDNQQERTTHKIVTPSEIEEWKVDRESVYEYFKGIMDEVRVGRTF